MKFPYKVNLCYIFNNKEEVLLQHKARGFGAGKWNGPRGKIKPNETPEEATVREIMEETGLTVNKLNKAGEIEFIFTADYSSNNYTYVYTCHYWQGKPENKGEGGLKQFKKEEIPLEKMWDDDKYWLMDVLNGKQIKKRFYFNKDGKVIKHQNI